MDSWTLVVLPILLGTVAMACNNLLRRYTMKSGTLSPLQLLVHWYVLVGLCYGAIYVLFWGFAAPKLLPGFWRAVICGSAVNFLIQFFNVKAASLDKGEVSLTAPLQAMTPGLITGLALLLGEFPSKIGCAGIFLMMCGSYILLWEKKPRHWYEYLGPLKRLLLLFKLRQLTPQERNKTLVVTMALGSACLGTIGMLFDGLYTRRGINIQGLTLALMTLVLLLAAGYAVWYLIKPDSKNSRAFGFNTYARKKYILALLGLAAGWIIAIYLIQPTLNHTFVAYTGTLKRFNILMSVVAGYIFFHEGEFKKRLWAAILIIAGVILISTDDLPSRISTQIQGWGL